ncbi:MAG: hypothetical protein Q8P41_18255 [Pseudomonadota bacterium]|nr:hypothetical protein [Pseudomonadota bacterium]
MRASLASQNVVIAANVLNPSLFTPNWLVRHGIVAEDDILPGIIVTDALAQVPTSRFSLLVLPQQLQFIPPSDAAVPDLLESALGRLIDLVPHTPFLAVGLNFHWHLDAGGEPMTAASRRLFGRADAPVYRHFADADAQFGAYLSRDVAHGARLKLDIKPALLRDAEGNNVHRLLFAFNFHKAVGGDNAAGLVREILAGWAEFDSLARTILADLGEAE